MKLRCLLVAILLAGCAAQPEAPPATFDQSELARTAEAHAADVPLPTPAATTSPVVAVAGRTVTYGEVGGKPVEGWLVKPANATGPLPGLIVIHEWWGLNDNVRDEAGRLAAEGYVVLAVDLYGGQVATAPPDAMKLAQQLSASPGPADENLLAAYGYLDAVEMAPRIGTLGWCLGGRWSLRTALLLPDKVDATVIYYGSVKASDPELARLRMPVIGFFGSRDPVIPVPSVVAFEQAMKRLGKNVEIHIYEGAEHAFANPSGGVYEPVAAEDSWRRTLDFLREHLVQ